VIPQHRPTPTPRSPPSRFGQERSAPAHPSVICAAGCHRVIVPRRKGCRPLASSMPAPRPTGTAGHQRRASNGGTTRSRAAPAPCAVAPVPQPVKFWLWLVTCRVDAGLGCSGLPAAAQARPAPALLRAGSPDRRRGWLRRDQHRRRGGPGDRCGAPHQLSRAACLSLPRQCPPDAGSAESPAWQSRVRKSLRRWPAGLSPVHHCRCGVLRPERWTAVAHAVYVKAKEGGRCQRQQHDRDEYHRAQPGARRTGGPRASRRPSPSYGLRLSLEPVPQRR
jgi:hypothetical protein